jgi:hypothetical protein
VTAGVVGSSDLRGDVCGQVTITMSDIDGRLTAVLTFGAVPGETGVLARSDALMGYITAGELVGPADALSSSDDGGSSAHEGSANGHSGSLSGLGVSGSLWRRCAMSSSCSQTVRMLCSL